MDGVTTKVEVNQRMKEKWKVFGKRRADRARTFFWFMVFEAVALFFVGIYLGQ
jgi:hypothetical protein